MLTDNGAPVSDRLLRRMDRAAVVRMVRAMLDGSDLTIKALAKELVVANPHKPQNGQVRIEYVTGRVLWKGPVSSLLGLLDGYECDDGDDGPMVGADKILSTLCAGG